MGDITDMNLATRLVHAGEDDYPLGAVAPPIFETASFRLEDFAARSRVTELPANTTFYSGISNPTVAALEVKLAAIESAGAALAFNSGMAAITTAVLAICRNGGHIIVSDKLFVVTDNWFREDLPALGCEVTVVDFLDLSKVERSFRPNTRAVFFEEFTNPEVIALDLESIIHLAHLNGALAIVDNTYGSPALFRPIEYGADLVLHSATKYMSGHGRFRAGALAASRDLIAPIAQQRVNMGTIASPHSAAGIIEGLRTLDLRVGRASSTALRLAQLADDHLATAAVQYPGLPGSVGHEHATRLTRGRYGGMFSFKLANPAARAAVYDAFDVIVRATSLGDSVSLVDYWPAQDLFRISTGIEDPDDLADDLERALAAGLSSDLDAAG
jgi:methionine-gamma-lyase